MKLPDFKLERYFSRYEFNAPYLLCCSDCESFTAGEILDLEGEQSWRAFGELWLGYTESAGSPLLRREIASLYTSIKEENVLVFSGAEEAIFIFMNTALDPGDHIIVQYPCYQSLFEVARSIGCRITRWEAREEDNWEPDIDLLESSIKTNTRAIIINSPHNPTGHLMSRRNLERIVGLARSRGILVFSDEVYRFLEYSDGGHAQSACDLYENAVSLGVMSKTYGLPGLRIGWTATRNNDIYKKMASFKDYTTICNSAPGEFLATLALRHRESIVRRNLNIIKENLALLNHFFSRYSGLFSWRPPKAGPIAFPGIRWNEDVESFCHDLVNSVGVLLLPGNHYDFGDKNFRIGFGRKNMPQCLEKLEEYIQKRFPAG